MTNVFERYIREDIVQAALIAALSDLSAEGATIDTGWEPFETPQTDALLWAETPEGLVTFLVDDMVVPETVPQAEYPGDDLPRREVVAFRLLRMLEPTVGDTSAVEDEPRGE